MARTSNRSLNVAITGDASKAKKALADLDRSLGKTEKVSKRVSAGIGSSLAGFGLAAGALGAARAFDESAKVAAQSEAVLKSTGNTANTTADAMGALAGQIAKKTGIDDESIQMGANQIAIFKRVQNQLGAGNDIFDQATKLSVDLGVAMGTDTATAATRLGKALDDPIGGVGRLGKQYLKLSADQKAQIATMVESGDVMGAQKILLGELARSVGGSAEAQATSMGKAQVAVDNLAESLGGVMAPAIGTAATALGVLASGLGALPQSVQSGVILAGAGAIAYAKWGESIKGLGSVGKAGLDNLRLGLMGVTQAGGGAANKVGGMISSLGGLGPVAVGAAVGVGALAAAFLYTQARAKAAETDVQELIDAMRDGGQTAKEAFGDALINTLEGVKDGFDLDISGSQFRSFVKNLKVDAGDLMTALTGTDKQYKTFIEEFKRSTRDAEGGPQLADQLDKLRERYEKLAASDRKRGDITDEVTGKTKGATAATAAAAAAVDAATAAIDKATAATEASLQAHADQVTLWGDLAGVVDDARSKLQEFFNAQSTGFAATNDVEAALDGLSASFKENGQTIDADTEAGRANKDALKAAADAAVGAAIDVSKSSGDWKQGALSLQGYATRLGESARAAGMTEGEVQILLTSLGLTPAQIKTTFENNAAEAERKANAVTAAIYRTPAQTVTYNKLPDAEKAKSDLLIIAGLAKDETKTVTVDVVVPTYGPLASGYVFPGKADGGPVGPSMGPTLVGEKGPELVTWGGNGTVHTAGATKRMLSGSGGTTASNSPSIVVNVTVQGTVSTERQLTGAIIKGINEAQKRSTRPILAGVS